MTENEILAMKPGRDLDELVLREVLKENLFYGAEPYSTDIAYAWHVVESMQSKPGCTGCKACIEIHGTDFDGNTEPCDNPYWAVIHGHEAGGNTAPEAICKAALLAVMGGVHE